MMKFLHCAVACSGVVWPSTGMTLSIQPNTSGDVREGAHNNAAIAMFEHFIKILDHRLFNANTFEVGVIMS